VPTIPGIPGPYRLFFYSFDCSEPRHVHADRDDATCKFWLEPLALAGNHGFPPRELNHVRGLIREHLEEIIDAWNQHCGSA
jgi:hypothetical protein